MTVALLNPVMMLLLDSMVSSDFPFFMAARRSEGRDPCLERILVGGGRKSADTDLDLGPILLLPLRLIEGRSILFETDWLRGSPPCPARPRFLVGDRPRPVEVPAPLVTDCCPCDN